MVSIRFKDGPFRRHVLAFSALYSDPVFNSIQSTFVFDSNPNG